ncbi:MAG: large conductance mechanosensitive channel protein MscL [Bdellovibrionales bacterium CG10_big_fil_rev_8_21_14_0_10_45_34]|nr:MAG: large conductance mechanosensitive channel protein MscL [Bdellovibrionales bacterium CG10_big_fil_rev_8_21_14_0_10_45_34]
MRGFFGFLKNYNVIGLVIAVIVGGKLNELVSSLVDDLIVPVILNPVLVSTGAQNIRELNYNGVLYGKVIASLIDFLVIAIIVYLFAKFVLKEQEVSKK